MSNSEKIVTFPNRQELDAAAAEWLTTLDRDEVAPEDALAFHQWMAESDQHKAAFERISKFWDGLERLEELQDIALSAFESHPSRRNWLSVKNGLSIAASVLILIGATLMVRLYTAQLPDTYVTEIGEQRTIRLSDGSEVQLNTDSHIEVTIDKSSRRIRLARGEAHFVVATDPQRPFSVFAGNGVFTAVGTAYTVRLRPSSAVEVTVSEGRIAMAAERQDPHVIEIAASSDQMAHGVVLTAGQNAVFTDKVEAIAEISPGDLTRRASWRYGLLAYEGEPLSEVIADISRYTEMTIEITDDELQSLPVGGTFRVGEIDALFDALEVTFGLRVEYVNERSIRISQTL